MTKKTATLNNIQRTIGALATGLATSLEKQTPQNRIVGLKNYAHIITFYSLVIKSLFNSTKNTEVQDIANNLSKTETGTDLRTGNVILPSISDAEVFQIVVAAVLANTSHKHADCDRTPLESMEDALLHQTGNNPLLGCIAIYTLNELFMRCILQEITTTTQEAGVNPDGLQYFVLNANTQRVAENALKMIELELSEEDSFEDIRKYMEQLTAFITTSFTAPLVTQQAA